ncbi:hypothetical protein L6452_42882 [Arctium lappa]|uniref:Uncharacterized protein n=1 Tax=Arctium lappa TaxID=4217 RepID=A0ACB8XIV7_ARCLA|nr:hypothetical protein L6452_42882 [Arctium lappa]
MFGFGFGFGHGSWFRSGSGAINREDGKCILGWFQRGALEGDHFNSSVKITKFTVLYKFYCIKYKLL